MGLAAVIPDPVAGEFYCDMGDGKKRSPAVNR
jgi:hypothetical protein